MGDAIQQVAMVAEALEAARRVDTHVVTGSVKGALVYIWKSKGSSHGICLGGLDPGVPGPCSGEGPK